MKALEQQGKQFVKSSSEKESPTLSMQKEIFEELAYEVTNEIQDLRNQIDFNFKGKSVLKHFISLKGPRDGYRALEKEEDSQ